jgi:hypothetical protein
MERAGNPPPNVLLMLSMALGAEQTSQHVAAVADRDEAKLSTRKHAKVNRRRSHGTSLAARVFRSTI